MLANPYSIKCIVSDDCCVFARDVAVLLQNIEIEHPIGQVICTCCEEYHDKFGCGTKTVLYLIGQWTQVGSDLLHQGVPLQVIISVLRSCIEDCISHLDSVAFPVDKFFGRTNMKQNTKTIKSPSDSLSSSHVMMEPQGIGLTETLQDLTTEKDVNDDISWFYQGTKEITLSKDQTMANEKKKKDQILERPYINITQISEASENMLKHEIIASDESGKQERMSLLDEDFDHCFDHLEIGTLENACQNDKMKDTIKNLTEILSTSTPHLTVRLSNDQFINCTEVVDTPSKQYSQIYLQKYLDEKCQKLKPPILNSTLWSSRHLNSSSFNNESCCSSHEEKSQLEKSFVSLTSEIICNEENSNSEHEDIKNQIPLKLFSNPTPTSNCIIESSTKLLNDLSIESLAKKSALNENILSQAEIGLEDPSTFHYFSERSLHTNGGNVNNMKYSGELLAFTPSEADTSSFTSSFLNIQNSGVHDMPEILHRMKSLVHGLCHGSNPKIEDFLIESLKYQNRNLSSRNQTIQLDINRLHTCCIQGPTAHKSCFISGIALPTSNQQMALIDKNKTHTVLLVNGDVTYHGHHIGYQKLARVANECSFEKYTAGTLSMKDKWTAQVLWVINQLGVTILIVKGRMDKELMGILNSHHILVFGDVTYSAMKALANITEPVVYVADATKENIVSGVTLEDLNSVSGQNSENYLVLQSADILVQTLVLCHPTRAGLDVSLQEFWLCCHRLSSALTHGRLLPGYGQTELHIASYLVTTADALQKQYCSDSSRIESLYQAEILSKLSNSFQSFGRSVLSNTGDIHQISSQEAGYDMSQDPPGTSFKDLILDDYYTKVHGWRTAIQLVSILLQTDAHVVIGWERRTALAY